MKTQSLKVIALSLLASLLLPGCSGGGDKDEMAPLSDKELLERANAGHNPGAAGSAGPPPGTPGATGGPQRPAGR